MGRLRIAVATNEKKGLEDRVSKVFGRAKTFTIMDAKDQNITDIHILENPAVSYHHGAGPISVKMLIDEGVEVIIANELGIGAAELLKQHNIKHMTIKPNTPVEKAVREAIRMHKETGDTG